MTDIKENTTWQGGSIDRQLMIDKIYRYIATQKVSYRCNNCDREYVVKWDCNQCFEGFSFTCNEIKENNPVMIWDILDWLENNEDDYYVYWDQYTRWVSWYILEKRKEKRKPIEAQEIDCIKYLYNIVSER